MIRASSHSSSCREWAGTNRRCQLCKAVLEARLEWQRVELCLGCFVLGSDLYDTVRRSVTLSKKCRSVTHLFVKCNLSRDVVNHVGFEVLTASLMEVGHLTQCKGVNDVSTLFDCLLFCRNGFFVLHWVSSHTLWSINKPLRFQTLSVLPTWLM